MEWKRIALFLVSFLPTVELLLHADPVNPSGQWAIVFLLLTTSISVLQKLFKTPAVKYRRQLGLWAGWYTLIHVSFYLNEGGISKFLSEWTYDYQLIGVVAVVGLLLLTLTSTKWAQRKLRANWAKLHELMYVIIGLGLIHGTIATKLGFFTMWPFFVVAALIFFRKTRRAQIFALVGIAVAYGLAAVPEPKVSPSGGAMDLGDVRWCELGPPNTCHIQDEENSKPTDVPESKPVEHSDEIVSQSCINGKELTYYADGRRDYTQECSTDPEAYKIEVWDGLKKVVVTNGVYNG